MPAKPRKMLAIAPRLHKAVKALARKRKTSLMATTEELLATSIARATGKDKP